MRSAWHVPDNLNAQALREARLVIDATTGDGDLFVLMRDKATGKIAYDEPRASYFRDNLIVDLVVVFLLVDPKWPYSPNL